jgi:hypothetical protein
VVAWLLKLRDFAVSSGGTRGVVFEGVAFAATVGLTLGGSRKVEVRASGGGVQETVSSLAVLVTTGAPGAELPASSGIDTGVDGTLSRPRGLFATTK